MSKFWIVLIVIILLISFVCYLYFEDNFLVVTRYNIQSDRLNKSADGLKIVQISDFHNTTSKKLHKDLIEAIKSENPDIIVVTGDLIDANRTDIDISLNFIKNIKEVAPIYYVMGNHERGIFKKYDILERGLKDLGVNVMENKVSTYKKNDVLIDIVGIEDVAMPIDRLNWSKEKVNSYLDYSNYQGENFTILLFHRPEVIDMIGERENKIDVIFSGHYHGGQIRIPFVGGVVSPERTLFPEYTSGLKTVGNTTEVLSRGIGNSIFPFRINNRPELVIVEIEGK